MTKREKTLKYSCRTNTEMEKDDHKNSVALNLEVLLLCWSDGGAHFYMSVPTASLSLNPHMHTVKLHNSKFLASHCLQDLY